MKRHSSQQAKYTPTAAQIAAGMKEVRKDWDKITEAKRSGRDVTPVEVTRIGSRKGPYGTYIIEYE